MAELLDVVMPFVVIALWPLGYFLGRHIRGYAHVIVPFKDPVSLTLLALCIAPVCYMSEVLMMTADDPEFVWTLAVVVGFLVGYGIGYCSISVDVIFVAVHTITEHDMDIRPLVYYTNSEGRQCWQPQGFGSIVKSMIFGVHNPLQLSMGSIYRQRHVHLKPIFIPQQNVDVVDLAGIEVNEYEVTKFHIKFHVEARKYIPSPNCTDAPYDWIVRASEYEDVFVHYSELQVEAIEAKASLSKAAVRGGGEILTALSAKNPSQMFMDDLGIDLRKALAPEMKRKVRREMKNAPVVEADDADE